MVYQRIVVKIGSGVILKDGQPDSKILANIVDQVTRLQLKGVQIIIVTSGAIAIGRGQVMPLEDEVENVTRKQMYAAVGQVTLMSSYAKFFKAHNRTCAQILLTKEDFKDRQRYHHMRHCFENMLRHNVTPIINENDVIATGLVFTDNDELAGLVASEMNADAVIILTTVPGVLDGDPKDPRSNVITEIAFDEIDSVERYITDEKSSVGRGGMHTKFTIAKKLARQGITMHLVKGTSPEAIINIVSGKTIGTRFLPTQKVSGAKRRLAYSEGLSKGTIYINAKAEDVLSSRRAVSLLPVGIVRVSGEFKKGDIVEIHGERGKKIGFGIAQYDAERARGSIGKQRMKPLIHYDYMFLG